MEEEENDEYPMELDNSLDNPEDYEIKPSDNILIAGKIEQEFAGLEVYVFEDESQNLFVYSDLILSSFPTCLEWLGADFSQIENNIAKRGHFAIVGMMTPEIEIWDLDVADPVEPMVTLGGNHVHKDTVTGLHLHPKRINLLVSSSLDKTIKVWDIQTQSALVTNTQFKQPFQNVFWDVSDESSISCLDEKGHLNFFDIRSPEKNRTFKIQSNLENYCQNPTYPDIFYLTSEKGEIMIFDRKVGKVDSDSIITIHTQSIPSVLCSINNHVITNSLDSKIKILDGATLKLLKEYDTKADHLLGSDLHPENPNLFACGSSKGEVVIWDFEKN
jgi:periodic tryptophan protein 1